MRTKRRKGEEEKPEHHTRWEELTPDALALIFSKVSIYQRFTVIPRVCKSWSQALSLPLCWQIINLLPWTYGRLPCPQPGDPVDITIRMVVARSSGSLRALSVHRLQSHSIFTFIAQNAGCLQTLVIPESNLSDSIVEQIAGRLSSVTFIDVSHCMNMGARGLKVIGNNCKLLKGLCRRMPSPYSSLHMRRFNPKSEAMAIASTMPNLKHLDIDGHKMTTKGVGKILRACSKLEYLSLLGCDYVEAQNLGLKTNKFPKLTVWGPLSTDYFDGEGLPWVSRERKCREIYELLADTVPEASDYFYEKDHAYYDIFWDDQDSCQSLSP